MVTPTIRLCTLGIKQNPDPEYSVYQNPGSYLVTENLLHFHFLILHFSVLHFSLMMVMLVFFCFFTELFNSYLLFNSVYF